MNYNDCNVERYSGNEVYRLNDAGKTPRGVWNCPSCKCAYFEYGGNAHLMGRRLSKVSNNPANIILFADHCCYTYFRGSDFEASFPALTYYPSLGTSDIVNSQNPHSGGKNLMFVDGHVEYWLHYKMAENVTSHYAP